MGSEDKLVEFLKKLEKTQEEIDKKTQQVAVYRDYNIKLFNIIKIGIISLFIFLLLATFILGFTAITISNSYFDYEQNISRTVVTESDDIQGSGESIILNRSNEAVINGKQQ